MGEKSTLLLVDEDARSLRVLEVSLRKAGYIVLAATNFDAAMQLADAQAPDLLLTEVKLGPKSGFDLATQLRERSPLGVLFISAASDPQTKLQAIEVGADDFLSKPVLVREVISRVKNALSRFAEGEAPAPMRGALAQMTVLDILQLMEAGAKSGLVHLSSNAARSGGFVMEDHAEGRFVFREGQLIDASLGPLSAEEAVYRALLWEDGDFEIELSTEIDETKTIECSTQSLILDGMRRVDQWSLLIDRLPSARAHPSVDIMELGRTFREVPEEVRAIVHLLDGSRAVFEVIDKAPCSDGAAIEVVNKLLDQSLLRFESASGTPSSLDDWLSAPLEPLPSSLPSALGNAVIPSPRSASVIMTSAQRDQNERDQNERDQNESQTAPNSSEAARQAIVTDNQHDRVITAPRPEPLLEQPRLSIQRVSSVIQTASPQTPDPFISAEASNESMKPQSGWGDALQPDLGGPANDFAGLEDPTVSAAQSTDFDGAPNGAEEGQRAAEGQLFASRDTADLLTREEGLAATELPAAVLLAHQEAEAFASGDPVTVSDFRTGPSLRPGPGPEKPLEENPMLARGSDLAGRFEPTSTLARSEPDLGRFEPAPMLTRSEPSAGSNLAGFEPTPMLARSEPNATGSDLAGRFEPTVMAGPTAEGPGVRSAPAAAPALDFRARPEPAEQNFFSDKPALPEDKDLAWEPSPPKTLLERVAPFAVLASMLLLLGLLFLSLKGEKDKDNGPQADRALSAANNGKADSIRSMESVAEIPPPTPAVVNVPAPPPTPETEDPAAPVAPVALAEKSPVQLVQQAAPSEPAVDPQKVEAGLRSAETALGSEDFAAAVGRFRTVLGLNPEEASAHSGLAYALLGQEQEKAAGRAAYRAVQLDPGDARGHLVLGMINQNRDQIDKACYRYRSYLKYGGGEQTAAIKSVVAEICR